MGTEFKMKKPIRPVPALNPTLYGLLRERFGKVLISAEGEKAIFGRPMTSLRRAGVESNIIHEGEYYRLCCAYCNDTRFRLYVNHLWHTNDPATGRPMHHLAYCFNNGCLKEHYADFEERVFGMLSAEARAAASAACEVKEFVDDSDGFACAAMPGEVIPLADLPATHGAVRYLASRGYDPRELGDVYGVGVCVRAFGLYPAMSGRIFIPVFYKGERVGWQGRWPADDWKKRNAQKYYNLTGFKKSRVLYGYDNAAPLPYVIVTEGCSDVWSVGPGGVALLGKTVSPWQKELLRHWANKDGLLVVMLDPEAWTGEQKDQEAAKFKHDALLSELTTMFRGRVVEVVLPGGRDPGSFSREVIRKIVKKQVRAAGHSPKRYEI